MSNSMKHRWTTGEVASLALVCALFGVVCGWAILLASAPAYAAPDPVANVWHQPYGGCEEASLAPTSPGAKDCRAHGWTIQRRLVVDPHGWVRGSGLPECANEDGSPGPLPCSWNFDNPRRDGLRYYMTKHQYHYVKGVRS